MKKLSSLFIALTLVVTGVVLGLSPVIVSATSTSEPAEIQNPVISISNPPTKDIDGIQAMCSDVNGRIHEKGIWDAKAASKHKLDGYTNTEAVEAKTFFKYSYKDNSATDGKDSLVNIEVNMIEYRKLKEKEKQVVMQQALNSVTNSDNISRTNKNKIYNNLCDLDVSTSSLVRQLSDDVTADFGSAYSYFKPWSGVLGTFLGVISLAMFIFLGITIAIDLAYIVLPFVQIALDSWGEKSKHSKGRAKLVSLEAVNAVKEAESKAGQEYTNPVSVYFSTKTKQLIAIALCLVYLVSGEIYNLIGAIMDYFNMAIGI